MSGLIDIINSWAGVWAASMLRASWQGGLALAAAWMICWLLRRGPARARCWVWRAALAKLVVAAVLPGMLAVPWVHVRMAAQRTEPGVAVNTIELAEEAPPVEAARAAAPRIQGARLSWQAYVMGAWFGGVLAGGVGLAAAWRRAAAMRRESVMVRGGRTVGWCEELARQSRVPVPEVRTAVGLAGPMLVGWRRPAILLPASLEMEERGRLVLAHEIAHVARRDLWWNWLLAAGALLFFFHPLVWLARRGWAESMEMACDEMALQVADAEPAAYGRMLLEMVAMRQSGRVMGVGVADSPGTLLRRVQAMKDARAWSKKRMAWAVGMIVGAASVAVIPWRVAAQPAGSPAPAPATAATAGRSSPAPAGVTTAAAKELRQPDNLWVGTITITTSVVHAIADGEVVKIPVREGQAVETGDLLVQIESVAARQAMDVARIHVDLAQTHLKQATAASQAGQALLEAAQEARSELQLAELELGNAQRTMSALTVTSPVRGVLDAFDLAAGQLVTKGQALMTIIPRGPMRVTFRVSEWRVKDARMGQAIRVYEPGTQKLIGEGKVTFISPRVENQVVMVRGELPASVEAVRIGSLCNVELEK
jgi:beta-lactamase regulating signal transducer with metallopeptidase domain